jgi:hypothetical protein
MCCKLVLCCHGEMLRCAVGQAHGVAGQQQQQWQAKTDMHLVLCVVQGIETAAPVTEAMTRRHEHADKCQGQASSASKASGIDGLYERPSHLGRDDDHGASLGIEPRTHVFRVPEPRVSAGGTAWQLVLAAQDPDGQRTVYVA